MGSGEKFLFMKMWQRTRKGKGLGFFFANMISGVYDVTQFLEDHPGGDEVLLAASGKDGTRDFEDVGHSDDARNMMKKYYIGEVDSSTVPAPRRPKHSRIR
ncbi:hypothetical protein V6N13_028109 [Hibiscus sabdariffa]|uniref:Cytochrome b5 heme-binding domain-containing protein n=1 Tax=Hibiscus sabdariffa TaxID=183260 RepID=A0ABR2B2C7_9ROSI